MTDSVPPFSSEDCDASPEQEAREAAAMTRALRRSLVVIAVVGALLTLILLWLTRSAPEPPTSAAVIQLPELRERPKAEPPRAVFTDVTAEAGLEFVHENGAQGEKLLPETMGGGCAFWDYDSDGDQDLLFVNSCRWPWDSRSDATPATLCLYQNNGQGRFADVTAATGLNVSVYGMGAAVGDYDNDGHVDLFVSAVGTNRLFHNTGGRFVDVTSAAGVGGGEEMWSSGCCWFDYNNDGRLDLFVGNYVRWSQEIDKAQDFRLVGIGRAYGPPNSFQGAFPYLYRNEGQGKFRDVSAKAGVQVANPHTGVPAAKTLGVAPIDLDADGWIDLVVANDTVQNYLFHNQHDGTFREVGATAGIAFDAAGNTRGAMGIDAAFFRNDACLGVAIGNFANEMTALYVAQEEPMQFVDAAIATGLGPETRLELTFGLFFFDYDLDGRLDLMSSNGHLEAEINKVQSSQHYEQPPQLFWNCGPDTACEFVPVKAEQCGEDLLRPMVGRGSAYADIDGDGDQDVLLTAVGGRPRLLRNDQALNHNWLRFKLVGNASNRDAIGAWIEVIAGEERMRRQVMPTRSYLSQSELPVTIGLGTRTQIDKVRVLWPDGTEQDVPDFRLNSSLVVMQPKR